MSDVHPIIVSACLLGEPCRYDAKAAPCEEVKAFLVDKPAVPVCPEQFGGLPTPRTPSERQPDGRVVDATGVDRTEAFAFGAGIVVELAQQLGCTQAILKSKSPSCGVHEIYDGTFSGTVVDGCGVTAEALAKAGLELLDEQDAKRMSDARK